MNRSKDITKGCALGIETKGLWRSRGAGLINFRSRLEQEGPVRKDMARAIAWRLKRG